MDQKVSMATEVLSSFLLHNLDVIMVCLDYFIYADSVLPNESNTYIVSVFNIHLFYLSRVPVLCLKQAVSHCKLLYELNLKNSGKHFNPSKDE